MVLMLEPSQGVLNVTASALPGVASKKFLPIRELMEQAHAAFQAAPFLPPRDLMAIAHQQVLKAIAHVSPAQSVCSFIKSLRKRAHVI